MNVFIKKAKANNATKNNEFRKDDLCEDCAEELLKFMHILPDPKPFRNKKEKEELKDTARSGIIASVIRNVEKKGGDGIFYLATNKNMDLTLIEKRVRKLGETSGIGRRVYPHLIRHTTATDGLDRGMPVEEVQQILGHVNIATTMIYAEVSKANVKNDHRRCIV